MFNPYMADESLYKNPRQLALAGNMVLAPDFETDFPNHITVTRFARLGPSRVMDATTMVEDGTTNEHAANVFPAIVKAASALTYEWSVWVQPIGLRHAYLRMFNGAYTSYVAVLFNLQTCATVTDALVNFTNPVGTIRKRQDKWLECVLRFTTDATADLFPELHLHNGSALSYAGDSASGLVAWRSLILPA